MPAHKHGVELKLLHGVDPNEVKRTTTDRVAAPRNEPKVPPNLSVAERRGWDAVTAELREMGLLSSADTTIIVHYVQAAALAERVHLQLAAQQSFIAVSESGMVRPHPLLAVWDQLVYRTTMLGSKLGLNPHARSVIHGRAAATPNTEAANVRELFA